MATDDVKVTCAEDVKEFAARSGITIDTATAQAIFEKYNKKGALSDDDLGSVSGGRGSYKDMIAAIESYRL